MYERNCEGWRSILEVFIVVVLPMSPFCALSARARRFPPIDSTVQQFPSSSFAAAKGIPSELFSSRALRSTQPESNFAAREGS